MSIDEMLQRVPVFVLVFFRLAGMVAFAPLFGSSRIPKRVKVLLTSILALGMAPAVTTDVALPAGNWELMVGIGGELIFGVAIGMILTFIFVSVQWAGEIIGQQMG